MPHYPSPAPPVAYDQQPPVPPVVIDPRGRYESFSSYQEYPSRTRTTSVVSNLSSSSVLKSQTQDFRIQVLPTEYLSNEEINEFFDGLKTFEEKIAQGSEAESETRDFLAFLSKFTWKILAVNMFLDFCDRLSTALRQHKNVLQVTFPFSYYV